MYREKNKSVCFQPTYRAMSIFHKRVNKTFFKQIKRFFLLSTACLGMNTKQSLARCYLLFQNFVYIRILEFNKFKLRKSCLRLV